MTTGLDSIKAELQSAADLPKIYKLQHKVDGLIDELCDDAEMAVIDAEAALLAIDALGRRIFVEHPDAFDITDVTSQSPVEVD